MCNRFRDTIDHDQAKDRSPTFEDKVLAGLPFVDDLPGPDAGHLRRPKPSRRGNPVAPARRSASVQAKASRKAATGGQPRRRAVTGRDVPDLLSPLPALTGRGCVTRPFGRGLHEQLLDRSAGYLT
jgi:hypothetical protein